MPVTSARSQPASGPTSATTMASVRARRMRSSIGFRCATNASDTPAGLPAKAQVTTSLNNGGVERPSNREDRALMLGRGVVGRGWWTEGSGQRVEVERGGCCLLAALYPLPSTLCHYPLPSEAAGVDRRLVVIELEV